MIGIRQDGWYRPAYSYIIHRVLEGEAVALCGKAPASRARGSGWYFARVNEHTRYCETCKARSRDR